jgi:hypothetical protein
LKDAKEKESFYFSFAFSNRYLLRVAINPSTKAFVISKVYFLFDFIVAFNGSKISGIVSAPHSLVVAGHGATWVQIVWQPPTIAHPTDKITYKYGKFHERINI